jgi:hypothetical protein
MIATFLEFNHSLATMTPLPTCLLCLLQEFPRVIISWTLFLLMPFAITPNTNFGTALTAMGYFPPVCITADVLWFDPFATPP